VKDAAGAPHSGRKATRESLSAYPEDWELLDRLRDEGLATSRSSAFQYLCGAYRRSEEERAHLEQARRIDPAEFAALVDAAATPPPANRSWADLLGED
jgi:hypothetical protein